LLQPLVISHYTIVNCLGPGKAATLAALESGRSGLQPCAFEDARLDTCVGQMADAALRPLPDALAEYECRNHRIADLALLQDGFEEAVRAAARRYGAARIGVFLGTSTSGILHTEAAYRRREAETGALPAGFRYATTHNTYALARFVLDRLGLSGPSLVVSTACSSSAKVFGTAARMIEAGFCDAAVVGGADSLCLTTLYGFGSLGLLARGPCRPFDAQRDGISIGEGAAFALLEKPGSHAARACMLLGVGESSDAYHMSAPHPEGAGARLAMARALDSAGLAPGDLDYINLHGTGTKANDISEEQAVYALFGPRTPASSTKGWTGHTLGASGIEEAIIGLLALEHGLIPGSAHTRQLDPAVRLDYAIENRSARIDTVMSNSFGFGGSNCTLILGRPRR